jgi:hypothetical protein
MSRLMYLLLLLPPPPPRAGIVMGTEERLHVPTDRKLLTPPAELAYNVQICARVNGEVFSPRKHHPITRLRRPKSGTASNSPFSGCL